MAIYKEAEPLRGNPIWQCEKVVEGFSLHLGESARVKPIIGVALIDGKLPSIEHDKFYDVDSLQEAIDAVRFADFALIGIGEFLGNIQFDDEKPVLYDSHIALTAEQIRKRGHILSGETLEQFAQRNDRR